MKTKIELQVSVLTSVHFVKPFVIPVMSSSVSRYRKKVFEGALKHHLPIRQFTDFLKSGQNSLIHDLSTSERPDKQTAINQSVVEILNSLIIYLFSLINTVKSEDIKPKNTTII